MKENILSISITLITLLMTISGFVHTYFSGQINTHFRNVLTNANYLNNIILSNTSNYSQAHIKLFLLLNFGCLKCNENCPKECIDWKNEYGGIAEKIDSVNSKMLTVANIYDESLKLQSNVEKRNHWIIQTSSYVFFTLAFINILIILLFIRTNRMKKLEK